MWFLGAAEQSPRGTRHHALPLSTARGFPCGPTAGDRLRHADAGRGCTDRGPAVTSRRERAGLVEQSTGVGPGAGLAGGGLAHRVAAAAVPGADRLRPRPAPGPEPLPCV